VIKGEWRLHAVAGTVSFPEHLGIRSLACSMPGVRPLPLGHGLTRAYAVVNYEQAVVPSSRLSA